MYIHALGAKPRQACSYEPHRESYTTLWALLEGHILELDGHSVLFTVTVGIHVWKYTPRSKSVYIMRLPCT